ncbi:MAG: POTRA domain-containing protein [Verrucomicrobiia bacterium]
MKYRIGLIAMFVLAKISSGWTAETNASAGSDVTNAPVLAEVTNVPARPGPTLAVRAYRLEGDTALLPEPGAVFSNYTGQVNLARIHEGLDALQLFYRRSGFPSLSVALPQQTLTDGVVRVEIINPMAVGATNALARPLPEFEVLGYLVEGNAVLPTDQLSVLSNYTGRVDLPRIHEGLDQLQRVYRQSGFSNVNVTLPRQEPRNGIVRVKIVTCRPAGVANSPATPKPAAIPKAAIQTESTATPATNRPVKPAPTFAVHGYLIEGNTVLPPEKFGLLSNYTGRVEFARVREGLGQLQLLYRQLGFATIGVTLPRQKLTNGIVRVKVVEGKLASIKVEGNRHFSTNNILRALPSLDTNILLNTKWFQPELDRANANLDRQIYPVINPGLEPGTSDLTLKVKDRLPLHGRMEVNDKSTPGTPLLRLDTALQYNNLWQHDHQIGLDYTFSPQSMKTGNYKPQFYDQPMVASYSGFYRLPLGFDHGLREDYDRQPVSFGYNEITHKFDLPAATGEPELIAFASRSVSDTPVRYGSLTVITNTDLLDVDNQFAQRELTYNNDLGTKLTIPIREFLGVRSSITLGFDYKTYNSQTFTTNLTYVTLYGTNGLGERVAVTNLTVANAANRTIELDYLPISFGWSALRPDQWGVTTFSFNQNIFLTGLASPRKDFQIVAVSRDAGGNYTTLNAGLTRRQNLPDDWSLLLRANGQWASEALINNEQFALGGTSGVRGYQEGEAYGDDGWRVLFDVNAPPIQVGEFPVADDGESVPAYLRCSWFMDYGRVYLIDRGLQPDHLSEWGTGIGFFLTAGEHFDARLTVGWALADAGSRSNPNNTLVLSPAGSVQAYFSVGFQF